MTGTESPKGFTSPLEAHEMQTEYLEMVIKTNADITNLFDDLFNCDESTSPEDKLKLYRKLLSILDDIKTNFFKPMKFNPVFDFIENFVLV